MADKSFGVKELNLLGSSGTPSIDSPNDLNLNANTVAISTNLTVGSKLSVTSAGILTAVSGVVTYFGDGSFLSGIEGGVGANGSVNTTGIITASSFSGIWSGTVIEEEFGGTNQSTYTKGDILYASNTNTLSKLAAGSDTNILTLTSGVPAWEPAGTSGVPGINTEGTSTFENVVINGNAGIGSLNVTGVSTFNSHLVVQAAGVATFYNTLASDYSTHGSVVMHGGLGVSQMSNFGDGLNVIGHTELDNVNISGIVTAASANFTGNVSIGGTLTYEDVTNVDSVGVVTAQKGIRIGAGYSIGSTDPASEDIKYYGDGQYLDNIFTTGGGGQGGATIDAGVFVGTGLSISGVSTFSSLTANRVVTVGAGGSLVDNSLLGFDGVALTVTGNLFLPNAGNHMGIGTASKLGTGTDSLSVWANSVQSGVRIWASASGSDNNDAIPLQVADYQGTEYFRVANTGNIGIGTDDPVRNLHIHEPSPVGNAYLHMTTDATGGTTEDGFSLYVQPDGSTWYRARELTGRHIWTTENTETMRLTADANLGIGTNDPTASNINSALGINTSVLAVGVVTARTFYGDGTHLTGTGGGTLISGITVKEEGTNVGTGGSIKVLNFCGSTITATASGDDTAIITVSGLAEDAQYNLYAGTNAGANSDTDTCYNIGIGYSAAYSLNSGDNNVILGKQAGACLTSGQYNIFLGCHTGYNSNGTCNFFAVNGAGCHNDTGINNVFIGNASGRGTGASTKDASSNIAMGSLAGMCLDSGDHNVFLGELSGVCSTNACHNVFIGNCAGRGNRTGNHNVVMGYRSFGYSHTGTGSYNVLFGRESGCRLTSGDDNVFLGRCSAIKITTGNANVAIGYSPGAELDSGHHNILIGNQAGKNLISGSYNIAIGRGVEFSSATGDCQLVIGQCLGNWIVGDSSLNIGIGTTNPNAVVTSGNTKKLSVGILSAYQLYGDGQYLDNVFATSGDQGGATVDNGVIVGTGLSISGISTLSNVVIGDESAGWNTGGDDLVIGNGEIHSHTGMTLYSNANDNGSIWFSDSVTTDVVGLIQYRHNEEAMRFSVAGTEQLRIDSAGNVNVTGILTATSFSGDGTALTGLGGDTLISGITVKEGGTTVGTGGSITTINFVGDTVTATASGDHGVDVTIESSSPWLSNDTGIHTTARVGIGTTTATPAMLNLHADSSNNDLIVFSAAGAASTERITIGSTTLDNGTISFEGSEGTLFSITNNLSSGSIFSVNDISGIPSIDVDADGTIQLAPLGTGTGAKVGIGTTNPSTRLHVVGDVKVTGVVTATDFDSTSDIRLKTNIKLIDDPLAKVIQIEGVSFNWKKDNRPALGVIADQIEKVIPELVHGDDPKTVNYNGLVGLLIEVVKDQQTQIDDLNKRLSKLE